MAIPWPSSAARVLCRRAFCCLLAGTLFAGALACAAWGQQKQHRKDGRHQIDQLEELWRGAVLKSDTAGMANLLADDFMGISPNGTLQSRDQVLEALKSGKTHLSVFDVGDRKVRFYGKTAVVTCLAHIEGTSTEGELSGNFRYMRVYVRNLQGEWKIVSFEASRIRPGSHQ